jgi:hypothetical protein
MYGMDQFKGQILLGQYGTTVHTRARNSQNWYFQDFDKKLSYKSSTVSVEGMCNTIFFTTLAGSILTITSK